MWKYRQTTEYGIEVFKKDLLKTSIEENEILRIGFKQTDGVFTSVKNLRKTNSYIIVECEENKESCFPLIFAIKQYLDFYRVKNISVLLGKGKKIEEYLQKASDFDVLYLNVCLLDQGCFMPYDNVFMGKCDYEISPYPNLSDDKKVSLLALANQSGLNCKIVNGQILGSEYFSFLTILEKKMLDFSSHSLNFDKDNLTTSRVVVKNLTLPVVNNEYYSDLFEFLPKKRGKVEYNGYAGNVLAKNSGAFVSINLKNEENIEYLFSCIKRYVEDING